MGGDDSDLVVEVDESGEEAMVHAAVRQSLRTAREEQERAAGLTSAGAGSSKARAPTKAASQRAAAAEKRLARAQQGDSQGDSDFVEGILSLSDDSEDEPLSKGKGKQVAKAPVEPLGKAKHMTINELRKLRRAENRRNNTVAKEEAELRAKLGRKLTYVCVIAPDVPHGANGLLGREVHHCTAQVPPHPEGRMG